MFTSKTCLLLTKTTLYFLFIEICWRKEGLKRADRAANPHVLGPGWLWPEWAWPRPGPCSPRSTRRARVLICRPMAQLRAHSCPSRVRAGPGSSHPKTFFLWHWGVGRGYFVNFLFFKKYTLKIKFLDFKRIKLTEPTRLVRGSAGCAKSPNGGPGPGPGLGQAEPSVICVRVQAWPGPVLDPPGLGQLGPNPTVHTPRNT